ncbi:MFS transporter [Dactylosporangium vinaceum]|uniref:MFS transporter n=1 Tax=Dactylosporangium vinaceum TaxID=53362 RepID=A0ABV5MC62_9ACTN|nr:MFS transporter [Dactylosporangium vinaceum]UAB92077.1 MFS transporter [Dactylosporangium vinaceum]
MMKRSPWLGLAVLALPALLVSIDVFVLLLAMPRIGEQLHASSTEQLWILDVYGFLLSGFMITMGTLGDRIGRRRLLLLGAAGFGVASVVAAYSTGPVMLIAARAGLGIAGATLAPSALALISGLFPDPRRRGLAIGVWMVCFMSGAVIGPVVGGLLLQHFWWGSAFLLGVPPMLLLLVLGPWLLPEQRHPDTRAFDLPSVGLSLGAILPFVYGVKELARGGLSPVPLLAVAAAAVLGVVFVRRQMSAGPGREPLLDLRLFRDRAFAAALAGMFAGTMLTGAMMVFITQHLQLVDGLSPRAAGLWLLPAAIATAASFQVAPLLARRVPQGRLMAGGLLLSAAGVAAVVLIPAGAGPLPIIAAFIVTNLGMGPMVTLATGIVLGSAPPERAGSAGALNEVSGEFGYALGIALLGSLGTAVYRAAVDLPAGLPAPALAGARDTVTSATAVAAGLPGDLGDRLLTAAREASTTGLHVVAAVCAVALAGLAVVTYRMLRHLPPLRAAAPVQPESGGAHTAAAAAGDR